MYIDSGTGSILLQAAAALVFSLCFFFRQIKEWLKRSFKFRKEQEPYE